MTVPFPRKSEVRSQENLESRLCQSSQKLLLPNIEPSRARTRRSDANERELG
jgi:hypothetical protein